MIVTWIVAIAVIMVLAARGVWHVQRLFARNTFLFFLWIWATGHHLNPEMRRHRRFRQRVRHAGIRHGVMLLVLVVGWAWLAHRGDLEIGLACAGALTLCFTAAVARPMARRVIHHHTYVAPLHARLENIVGVPVAGRAREWLQVAPDNSTAKLMLPPSFDGSNQVMCDQLVASVSACLAIENPDVAWKKKARDPHVVFTRSVPPPASVGLIHAGDAIARAGDDRIVLAVGKRNTILDCSLHSDSPHIGMSIGSGHGKSVTARLIAAQVLAKDGLCVILDGVKRTSHPWARGLPNVIYADSVVQMHEALIWLGAEMNRRQDVAVGTMDIEGDIAADVGPRILIVFEEMGSSMKALRNWWSANRDKEDPKESPAISAWGDLSNMGRAARMNIAAIAQMLTVQATGGRPEIRENMSVRILGRYSANNWKMLAPEHAMPPKNSHPGLVQVITSEVREGQVIRLTGREALNMALTGTALFPSTVPELLRPVPGTMPAQALVSPVGTLGQADEPALMGVRQAVDTGLAGDLDYETVRKRLQRAEDGPHSLGRDGSTKLYDAFELRDWLAGSMAGKE